MTDATWNGITGDYLAAGNWGGTVPDDTAIFSATGVTAISIAASAEIGGWSFDAVAQSYSFTISSPASFIFSGAGIAIDSGSADITVDSALEFQNSSSAGSSSITNGATGTLSFVHSSTAGSSDITNNSTLQFSNSSTAGSATITTNNLGSTEFYLNSTAGDARLITELGGTVDFSSSTGLNNDNQLSAGSIEGAGTYKLGAKVLTVGGNDDDTEVEGSIEDGGLGGGIGGSLVKTGTGTLIVSNNFNSYTGGTTINEGTLQVDGTILGTTTVNTGGTLGGSGTTGAVNVAAGGTVGPGASAGILHTGAIAFAAVSNFSVELGVGGHDQLDVTGTVALGDASLSVSLIGGFDPSSVAADEFEIISNDGDADPVTGTFAGLAEGAEFLIGNRFFTVSYTGGDGNDVVLTSGGALIMGTVAVDTIDGVTAPAGEHVATEFRDLIIGGAGPDQLSGLGGDDIFRITGLEGLGDTYAGGTGNDTLEVVGPSAAILVSFNAAASSIEQWLGNNQGVMGTSSDNLFDFSGLVSKTGLSFVDGLSGNDTIIGSSFADDLLGGADIDTLRGGDGNDTLTGGRQRDVLTGGADRDLFDFNSVQDTKKGGQRDIITDFHRGNNITGDDIDLRTIDAKTGGGNQAFKWIGKQGFHHKKGELHYKKSGDSVIVQGDTNGDGKADFEILVQHVGALAKGDFLL